jgi:hypothetical protein
VAGDGALAGGGRASGRRGVEEAGFGVLSVVLDGDRVGM